MLSVGYRIEKKIALAAQGLLETAVLLPRSFQVHEALERAPSPVSSCMVNLKHSFFFCLRNTKTAEGMAVKILSRSFSFMF